MARRWACLRPPMLPERAALAWAAAPLVGTSAALIAAKMTPIPLAPQLEDYCLPSLKDVVDAARRLVQY